MKSPLPLLLMIVALALPAGPAAARSDTAELENAPPEEVVSRLENTVIDNMKAGETMTYDERFERLRPLLADIMAIEHMGRFLFGRDWASFSSDRRTRFEQAFLDLSAATYAGRFDEFNGEKFNAVGVDRQAEDRAVVRRRLTTGKGRKIAFDYLMTRSDSGWRIVTIIIDGVSDLAVKRSQYRRILADQGFDAVVAHIRDSIESQRSG